MVLRLLPLAALLGLVTIGCGQRHDARETRSDVGSDISAPSTGAPTGERLLDTNAPAPAPAPAPRILVNTNAPLPAAATTTRAHKARKPGSDEHLPSWVPVRGRLTVVEANDLAENLGLVPKGTTKAARVSVAEALTQQSTSTDNTPRSATWLASNGRVRSTGRGFGRGR